MDNNLNEEEIDIKALLFGYLKYWYWFLLSIFVCLVGAYIYLRYAPNIYQATAKVLVIDADQNNLQGGQVLEELGYFSTGKGIDTEMEIIKSYSSIEHSVKKLPFTVSYWVDGDVRTSEVYYKNSPFTILLDTVSKQLFYKNFFLKPLDNGKALVSIKGSGGVSARCGSDEFKEVPSIEFSQIVQSGDTVIHSGYFKFIYYRNEKEQFKKNVYRFKLEPLEDQVLSYQARLAAQHPNEFAAVLNLSIVGKTPEKNIEFLNQLANDYVNRGLLEKNKIAENTLGFINHQIDTLRKTLNETANTLQKFRTSHDILDFEYSSKTVLNQLELLNKEKAELMVQDKYYRYLNRYVKDKSQEDDMVSPSLIGVRDPLLINLLHELEVLFSKKNELDIGANKNNPALKIVGQKIISVKKNVIENLTSLLQGSAIRLTDINKRISKVSNKARTLPKTERELLVIEREFNLNEEVYNYLLEKKASIGIAKAGYIADNKVLEKARLSKLILKSPNRSLILLAGVFLGILIPVILIFGINFFNTKIKSVEELEKKEYPLHRYDRS